MSDGIGEAEPDGSALPIAICVPARDEAAALPRLFAALDQLDRTGTVPTLCLLLDSCKDRSADIARDYALRASLPIVLAEAVQSAANVGHARHGAMLLGQRALGGPGLLLTTDADSMPASDWLQAMIAGLRHADVVAGKVERLVTEPNLALDRLERYYDALHAFRRALDPVAWEGPATHHCTSGANLGLSVDAYRALGGFAPIASGEDARLVDEAARAGLRVRRDAACVVRTSDRRVGRVACGIAATLRALDRGDGAAVDVAHPHDAAWQYYRHAIARAAFDSGDLAPLREAIGLSDDHLRGVARDCAAAEAFAMRVVPTPPGGMRQVPLAVAEAALSLLVAGRQAA